MADLILGTATFGKGYGVSNKDKKFSNEKIREIVRTAISLGIKHFDTAPAYGDAEKNLGEFLTHHSMISISSKISRENGASVKLMLASVNDTLLRTKVKQLENLYLHDPDALVGLNSSETIAGLKEIISQGLVRRVGVSVYSMNTLLRSKEICPELTVFQVPENICDRRLFQSSELAELKTQGNHFILRSIFLQGLLLMPPEEIPSILSEAKKTILQLRAFAISSGIHPLDLCMGYAKGISWASGIIIGAANAAQLREIIRSQPKLPENWDSRVDRLPEVILDPRKW
jgi:aryl-alcohol dehydrogenase-like predicted oxidoreductase